MKKLVKFFLIISFSLVARSSHACDFIDVPIGTSMTQLNDRYEGLVELDEEETDDTVYKYIYRAKDLCKEEELRNSYLLVFVQNLKLIGMRIEVLHDDLEKKDIYKFTKSNIGTLDDRAEKENWFGTIQLDPLGNRYILFSKRKTFDSKLFETLLITESDYIELIYSPDVEEAMM